MMIAILMLSSQETTSIEPKVNWLTPSHLEITYRQPASIDFQAIKCAGIEISVRDLSTGKNASTAMERGSDIIEPIDLLKAIYVVDLEHVAAYWYDWERFESIVSNQQLENGQFKVYINRMSYLIYLEPIS